MQRFPNSTSMNPNYPGIQPPMVQIPPQETYPLYQRNNYQVNQMDGGFLSDILEDLTGIFINQKADWQKIITGWAKEQTFQIHDFDDKKGPALLECKEKSGICSRGFFSARHRPFTMEITNLISGSLALVIERKLSCTILCFDRPKADVYYIDENNQKVFLGQIEDKFSFKGTEFVVRDEHSREIYTLFASLCETGMGRDSIFEICNRVRFEVFDQDGRKITSILKKGKNCCGNSLSQADKYEMQFGIGMDWKQRALMISAILFLNFRLFEDMIKKSKKKQ